MSKSIKAFCKVAAIVELTPIELPGNQPPLRFRIEIMQNLEDSSFFPRVFRYESFEMTPSFRVADRSNAMSTETILINLESASRLPQFHSHEEVTPITFVNEPEAKKCYPCPEPEPLPMS